MRKTIDVDKLMAEARKRFIDYVYFDQMEKLILELAEEETDEHA